MDLQDIDHPFQEFIDGNAYEQDGPVRYYHDLVQGCDEWHEQRLGTLTASEMKLIITPTLKVASNEKERAHLYELLAQRITKHVEPQYVSDDMLHGHEDEVDACILYSKQYEQVKQCGFITNDKFGFKIGFSPDGLVGDDGAVECKSRRAKYQIKTIIEHINIGKSETVPAEYMLQLQTGLLVSEREWIDFISYSGGLPMAVIRVYPIQEFQDAIIGAATAFEERLQKAMSDYAAAINSEARLIPTKRKIYEEMTV